MPAIPRVISIVIVLLLSAAAMFVMLHQCRKPRWLPGRLFLWIMNRRHASMTNWGLTHVSIEPQFTILDVGCGGGRTIRTLATVAAEGRVDGIDYSETSVAASTSFNAALIESGRVRVQHASVSRLPFADETFDLVTAVETHYYWPEPVADMQEILRVLKPGGRLVVIAETYDKEERSDGQVTVDAKVPRVRFLSVRQHRKLFSAAGFSEIAIDEEVEHGWICGVARKLG